MENTHSTKQRTLFYLSLQATNEGQAGYTHVHEIIKGLRKRNWKVTLHSPHYSSHTHPYKKLLICLAIQARMLLNLRKADAVYLRAGFLNVPTVAICAILGKPCLSEINGPIDDAIIAYPSLAKFRKILTFMHNFSLTRSSSLIVVTKELGLSARNLGYKKNIYFIPNGANTDLFKPESGSSPSDKPYVMFFGALAEWQGIQTVLDAKGSADWPSGLELYIAGDGELRQAVVDAANNDSEIKYLGKVEYRELPRYVSHSVLTLSVQTNFSNRASTGLMPLKVFESLACGVPVIVSNFPGMSDVITDSNSGLVVEPDNPNSLVKAISKIFSSQERRAEMSENARNVALKEHSWDKRSADTNQAILNCFSNTQPNSATTINQIPL